MTTKNPQEPFKRITAQEAKEMIAGGDVDLIDVRRPDEYAAGHLHGAKLIPHDALFERMGEVSEDKQVIFYCAVGQRSALACEIGAAMGRTSCHNLEGGIQAWQSASFPVEV